MELRREEMLMIDTIIQNTDIKIIDEINNTQIINNS